MARKSTEPKELPRAAETLRLLDELEAKGLTEAMFELIHHQGEEQAGHCLAGHRRYCEELVRDRTGFFQSPDAQNAQVQRRLRLLADRIKASSHPGEVEWEAAIHEALRRVPLVRGRT